MLNLSLCEQDTAIMYGIEIVNLFDVSKTYLRMCTQLAMQPCRTCFLRANAEKKIVYHKALISGLIGCFIVGVGFIDFCLIPHVYADDGPGYVEPARKLIVNQFNPPTFESIRRLLTFSIPFFTRL